jgi:hypothetical protein
LVIRDIERNVSSSTRRWKESTAGYGLDVFTFAS